jgi:PDZ domain-containing protein
VPLTAAASRAGFRGRLLAAVDTIPANPSDADEPLQEPADPVAPIDQEEAAANRRRSVLVVVMGVFTLVLVGATAAGFLIHLPYYLLSPGDTFRTQSVIEVTGAPTYHDTGSVEYVTVSITTHETTVFEWAWAHFQHGVTIAPASQIVPPHQSPAQNQAESLREMTDSKTTASVVALEHLGYKVVEHGTGAVVIQVINTAPAANVLKPGDTIVSFDGHAIGTTEQLTTVIHSLRPGTRITLVFDPDKKGAAPQRRTVTLASNPNDKTEAFLGVASTTRDPSFDLPVKVTIKTEEVGGPSAGLAFTMGLLDVMTKGSITGGQKIATTGTMDLNGCVGPIGGMHQKVLAVKSSGAVLFLVPRSEYAEAERYAGSLKVVAVDDVDDALAALAKIGGGSKVVPPQPGDDGEAALCKPHSGG